jgi:O-antigen ligase
LNTATPSTLQPELAHDAGDAAHATPVAEDPRVLLKLRAALVALVFYGTYQNHFTIEFGIKGLNLMTLLFMLAAWWTASLKNKAPAPAPLKGFFWFFFVALVWSFVAGQLRDSSTMMDDLTVVKNMLFAMLLYFVSYHAGGDKRTRQVLFAAILGVTALVTIHVWRQALDYGIGTYNESRRASGPFGPDARASNRAAAFFIIFLPVMLTAALYLRERRWLRLFALAFTVLGVGGVFFTYSRQAYVLVALLFVYLAFRRNWLFALVVVAFVLSYEAWAPQGVIDRVQTTQQEDASGEKKLDESTESRFIIWSGAAEIIANNPMGIGLNHFQRTIGDYVPQYAGYDAHNNYVRFTTEGGIPGIVAMVLLLLALFALSRRVLKVDDTLETRLMGTAFTVAVLGVIFSNLYGSRFFDADIMGAFWILAGIATRHYTEAREQARRAAEAAPPLPHQP